MVESEPRELQIDLSSVGLDRGLFGCRAVGCGNQAAGEGLLQKAGDVHPWPQAKYSGEQLLWAPVAMEVGFGPCARLCGKYAAMQLSIIVDLVPTLLLSVLFAATC